MYSKEEKVDMEMIQDVDDDELHAELVQMVMCGDDNDGVLPNPSTDFDAMGTNTITEREIWHVDERENQGNLLDLNDSSSNMFYDEQFPVLPNFSPMSASSSSSSTPAPTKPIVTSSASSASTCSSATASWAMLKLDNEEDMENKDKDAPAPSGATLSPTLPMEGLTPSDGGTIDCMELMEGFGYMDLLDSNEIWDPSSIFDQTPQELLQLDDQFKQDDQQHDEQVSLDHFIHQEGRNGNRNNVVVQDEEKPFDEMGLMFLEWLKSNKDTISAEDLRSIKLKTSTVDCATKRLGNSKEGQKKLVKLILDWVAKCQLRKKREEAAAAAAAAASAAANQYPYPSHEPPPQIFPNPNPNYNYGPPVPTADPNSRFSPPPWMPAAPPMQSYVTDPAGNMMAAPPPAMAYMGSANTYNNPSLNCANPYNNYEYQMLDSSQPWNQSQMTMAASHFTNPYNDHMGHMGNNNMVGPGYVAEQYPYTQMYNGNGDQMLMKSGSSATKEARKRRMARQRRFSWNHHPRHHHPQQNHQNQANFDNCSNKYMGNWGYWAPAVAAPGVTTMQMMAAPPPPPQMDAQPPPPPAQQVDQSATHGQNGPKQTPPADKKQGWKSEKNLKFLLQKVLKQSDVGNLGRIVLPKKEAETHLPELESRDGISISMEDIGTSKVWDMRYRFWPNNKSRMYLLENTGDFVKANELQEGDFIVLYSDMKYGKYLIRGVKVREPGKKPEPTKKPTKRNQRNGTLSSPNKKHHKKENEKEKEKEGGDNV